MVIEHVKNNDFKAISERFRQRGWMLPEGLIYHASWVDSLNARCSQIQIMEPPDLESLNPWIAASDDLVDFEVVPVQTSAEFWATIQSYLIYDAESLNTLGGYDANDAGYGRTFA